MFGCRIGPPPGPRGGTSRLRGLSWPRGESSRPRCGPASCRGPSTRCRTRPAKWSKYFRCPRVRGFLVAVAPCSDFHSMVASAARAKLFPQVGHEMASAALTFTTSTGLWQCGHRMRRASGSSGGWQLGSTFIPSSLAGAGARFKRFPQANRFQSLPARHTISSQTSISR